MRARIRVERVVTDRGYGPGWVVLSPRGFPIVTVSTWQRAYELAYWYARAVVPA